MNYRVFINDTVRNYLVAASVEKRRQVRKSFEFLESGLWDGGVLVKKLKGVSRTVLEGRINRSDRVLFTLGERSPGVPARSIYVWDVVEHDRVDRQARFAGAGSAAFLQFREYFGEERPDLDLDTLSAECFAGETAHDRHRKDWDHERWFVLGEKEWQRLLIYQGGDFEIFLYLTADQEKLLQRELPLFLSGTAGSGKSTLAVYYLLRSPFLGHSKLFLTYNASLARFAQRLYQGLKAFSDIQDPQPPLFLTFDDLCRRLVADSEKRFPPSREVDVFAFEEWIRRQPAAAAYDYALIWEEIRSILKGGKPQLDTRHYEACLRDLKKGVATETALRRLKEELLALDRPGLCEQAERIVASGLATGLKQLTAALEEQFRSRPAELIRVLETILRRLRRKDSDVHRPLMSLEDYETLGRKRAPNFRHDRRRIYELAAWYQEQLTTRNSWDEIDLTRAALQSLDESGGSRHPFDLVICDEVQDFTDLQLSLIMRLPSDPRHLLLAGDPKQIVNPSGFRWEEARRLFYDRGLPVPDIHHLTLNFRCSGSIVQLANALLRLKQKLLGTRSHEKFDEWKYMGRPACLLEGVEPKDVLQEVHLTGSDRIILTRSEAERDRIKELLETELVMTIREAKGLEWGTVLLWRFSAGAERLWRQLLNDSTEVHEALIRHEFNLLYVAMTRARQNLILYDGAATCPVWEEDTLAGHLFRSSDLGYLRQAWQVLSSPQEWQQQGDYSFDHERYRSAAECYRNAECPDLMNGALALEAERKGAFSEAARLFRKAGDSRRAAVCHEQAREFRSAQELWNQLGETDKALHCGLKEMEIQGSFEQLADYWELQGALEKALHFWEKAGRPDRTAPLFLRLRNYLGAAGACEKTGDFESAARWYQKVKRLEDAARCFEKIDDWEKALILWLRLKRKDEAFHCLTVIGDPLRLAEFFESEKDWNRALEQYQAAWSETLRNRFEQELENPSRAKSGPGRRAVRLSLLDRPAEAADAWEKARQYGLAADCHRRAQRLDDAARCLARAGEPLEAARLYARAGSDRRRRYQRLRLVARKAAAEKGPKARQKLHELGLELVREGAVEAASWTFEAAGQQSYAIVAAAAVGQIQRARRLYWKSSDSLEKLAALFSELDFFRPGTELFDDLLCRTPSYAFEHPALTRLFETLLTGWRDRAESGHRIELELPEIVACTERHLSTLSPPTLEKILEPAGQYDLLWRAFSFEARRPPARFLRQEAERREAEGDFAGAGLRYLCLEMPDPARRCWEKVVVNDGSLTCHLLAGLSDRAIDFLQSKGDLSPAIRIALNSGQLQKACQMIDSAGCWAEGAAFLQLMGYREQAVQYFQKAGDLVGQARVLEQLKRFEEAAHLWQQAGNQSRVQKCRQKAMHTRQTLSQGSFF